MKKKKPDQYQAYRMQFYQMVAKLLGRPIIESEHDVIKDYLNGYADVVLAYARLAEHEQRMHLNDGEGEENLI